MSGGRAIVVDDHAGFRAIVRRFLESEGWRVVGEAADGAGAISAATELRPDLILLDVGLPDIDGFAVAERLTAAGTRGIVLISSREAGAYGDRVATTSAAGFMAKGDLDGATLRALLAAERR